MNVNDGIYVIMETNYLKALGFSYDDDISSLFPRNWYDEDLCNLKCKILLEAINNKVKIQDTKLYREEFPKSNCNIS